MFEIDRALTNFLMESNRLNNYQGVRARELEAVNSFLGLITVQLEDMNRLVDVIEPGAKLRNQAGMNLRLGKWHAPKGGPMIQTEFIRLLSDARSKHPYEIHQRFLALMPYTDANGRAGRVLWLWGMSKGTVGGFNAALQDGFLRTWYSQSLDSEYRNGKAGETAKHAMRA